MESMFCQMTAWLLWPLYPPFLSERCACVYCILISSIIEVFWFQIIGFLLDVGCRTVLYAFFIIKVLLWLIMMNDIDRLGALVRSLKIFWSEFSELTHVSRCLGKVATFVHSSLSQQQVSHLIALHRTGQHITARITALAGPKGWPTNPFTWRTSYETLTPF